MEGRIDENELSDDSRQQSEEENDFFEDETADEKRVRVSKQYLAEIDGGLTEKRAAVIQDLETKANKHAACLADWYATNLVTSGLSGGGGCDSGSEEEEEVDEETETPGGWKKSAPAAAAGSKPKPKAQYYGRLHAPEFRKGHLRPCTSVCVRKDGEKIYSGGKDCAVLEWDVEAGTKVVFSGGRKKFDCGGHFEQVLSVAYCDKLQLLVSVGEDALVRLWDPRCPKACIDSLRGHNKSITKVVSDPDTTQIFTASTDRQIKLWDLQHRAVLDTYLGHTEPITDMDIFKRGTPITGSTDKTARFWKTMRDSHLVFAKHTGPVDAVCALQSDKYVTGGQDGDLHVWSQESGRPIASVTAAHGGTWVSALSCHRNSDFVLSGASDGFVRCWKLASGADVPADAKKAAPKKRKRGEAWTLQPLQQLPVPGVVNQIVESQRYWVCAIGQEHRFGRWERHTTTKQGICIIRKAGEEAEC